MEFNKKLQELRKSISLTQEQLAKKLFVSRTAISKWESGKGYPSIDSLKLISNFFGITVDELISSDELLSLAKENKDQTERHFHDLVFGLLDVSLLMLLFLPFFRQTAGEAVQSVSLLAINGIAPYLKVAFSTAILSVSAFGILTLALQNFKQRVWLLLKSKISLMLCAFTVILFVISSQPYAAVYLFIITAIKALMLIK
jgi:transcriptional regulator with XRE-family HTH domain